MCYELVALIRVERGLAGRLDIIAEAYSASGCIEKVELFGFADRCDLGETDRSQDFWPV